MPSATHPIQDWARGCGSLGLVCLSLASHLSPWLASHPSSRLASHHSPSLACHPFHYFASHPFHCFASQLSPCLAGHPSHRLASHPFHCFGRLSYRQSQLTIPRLALLPKQHFRIYLHSCREVCAQKGKVVLSMVPQVLSRFYRQARRIQIDERRIGDLKATMIKKGCL